MTRRGQLLAAALTAAALLAGCGGDDQDGGGPGTVAAQTIDGEDVVVDARGRALYTAEQEAYGKVRCTAGCAAIWLPLTVPAGREPSAGSGVAGDVGVVERPDGGRQVTLDGAPLYRFAEDRKPGDVTGDGLSDRFGGREFTWQVVGGGEKEDSEPGGPYGY